MTSHPPCPPSVILSCFINTGRSRHLQTNQVVTETPSVALYVCMLSLTAFCFYLSLVEQTAQKQAKIRNKVQYLLCSFIARLGLRRTNMFLPSFLSSIKYAILTFIEKNVLFFEDCFAFFMASASYRERDGIQHRGGSFYIHAEDQSAQRLHTGTPSNDFDTMDFLSDVNACVSQTFKRA